MPKNLQRRSKSSTRVLLARDLHDSIAQDLIAIGFKLDLLLAKLPAKPAEYRTFAREIRFLVSESIQRVRREMFALRSNDETSLPSNDTHSIPIEVSGDIAHLPKSQQRIIQELVRNAQLHSKGRLIKVSIEPKRIKVSDDGQGLFGISEQVAELGGTMSISCNQNGTVVEIRLP